MISCTDFVDSSLVDEEIAIYGNHCDNGPIVDDFLLDVLLLFGDAVVRYFEFLAVLGSFLAFLGGIRLLVIGIA